MLPAVSSTLSGTRPSVSINTTKIRAPAGTVTLVSWRVFEAFALLTVPRETGAPMAANAGVAPIQSIAATRTRDFMTHLSVADVGGPSAAGQMRLDHDAGGDLDRVFSGSRTQL